MTRVRTLCRRGVRGRGEGGGRGSDTENAETREVTSSWEWETRGHKEEDMNGSSSSGKLIE